MNNFTYAQSVAEYTAKFIADAQKYIEDNFNSIRKNPQDHKNLKASLEEIAHSGSLVDSARAEADNMLFIAFNDPAANSRREQRFGKIVSHMREREELLQSAIEATGVEVHPHVRELLKSILTSESPDVADIVCLLRELLVTHPAGVE